jgi:GDP-L-fucose synthase
MKEEYLLTGPLEPTNEWYAVAKIAGLKMCQAYRREFGFKAISLMPTNLYGPGDNFDLENSHVLPALIRRFHLATQRGESTVTVWGTGKPRREFLHVDDLADAVLHLLEHYDAEPIVNVGWGDDVTISDLVSQIAAVAGFRGEVRYDATKPDGAPRKLLDTGRLTALGWRPKIALAEGIASTYAWFEEHVAGARL